MEAELGREDVSRHDGWASGYGGRVETFVCVNLAGRHVTMLGKIFFQGKKSFLECMRCKGFDKFITKIRRYGCPLASIRLLKKCK
jgi:hypothetical protein